MLSILIFLPLVMGCVLILSPKKPRLTRLLAGVFASVYFVFTLSLFLVFDFLSPDLQLVQSVSWFPELGLKYFVGIDGLSFWFVILTAFLLITSVFASWNLIQNRVGFFYGALFVMTTSVIGTFLAMDGILFYVFFESSLVPLYFLIGIWGGKKRIYSAFKFFIYTGLGSLFLLAGLVGLMNLNLQATGELSANVLEFYKLNLPFVSNMWLSTQNVLFFCFFLALAIKLPIFPFHTWLPLAHGQAPAPISAFLAGVILKMGAYGFFRFLWPMFPDSMQFFSPALSVLAGISLVYGALMALAQKNMKTLIAYSSVSHMAYVVLGLFSFNLYGLTGGFYQALSHALSSSALFLLVGMIYERTNKLNIADYSGVAKVLPWCAVFFVTASLSTMALPSTAGFIAEFLTLKGLFMAKNFIAFALALTGVVLGAVYMLYLIHRVFFGQTLPSLTNIIKLSLREKLIILPFMILIFVMGCFPNLFLKYSRASLEHLHKHRQNYYLNIKDTSLALNIKN